jgi:cyclase
MISARKLTGTGRGITRMGVPAQFEEGLYEVAPRTYVWMVPNGSWGETNIGLVDCGGRSVLIDTCWDLAWQNEMLRHAEPVLSAAPVERVVNTHGDGDHCWGNQLFADRIITATRACADSMLHNHSDAGQYDRRTQP